MFALKLFLILGIFVIIEADSFLPEDLDKLCIPTMVVAGRCHICICGMDGVFHCKEQWCVGQPKINARHFRTRILENECDPGMVYRDNNVICSCTGDGHWQANHCREKFGPLKERHTSPLSINKINRNCTTDFLYLLDCNVCQCSDEGIIDPTLCTSRRCNLRNKVESCSYGDIVRTPDELCSCSDINVYIDRLCLKVTSEKKQRINETDLAVILSEEGSSTRSQGKRENCVPYTALRVDCNTCFCTEKKMYACSDKMCVGPSIHRRASYTPFFELPTLRKKYQKSEFYKLPILKNENEKCTPGVKYRMSCNECQCSSKGVPICTTMFCLEDVMKRAGYEYDDDEADDDDDEEE